MADLLGKTDGIVNPAAACAGWSERKVTMVGRHDLCPGSKAKGNQVSCSSGESKLPCFCAVQSRLLCHSPLSNMQDSQLLSLAQERVR